MSSYPKDHRSSREGRALILPPGCDLTSEAPLANLSAEQSALGRLLLLNDSIDEVAEFLLDDHFYSDRHQTIFAAICDLRAAGVREIDTVTLSEELEKRQKLKEIGGVQYLLELLQCVPHAANLAYYANIVAEKAAPRGPEVWLRHRRRVRRSRRCCGHARNLRSRAGPSCGCQSEAINAPNDGTAAVIRSAERTGAATHRRRRRCFPQCRPSPWASAHNCRETWRW